MRADRLEMDKFMAYDNAVVELLSSGLTVVTGGNGSGKSSLPEALAAAFYGKTMRGTPFWRKGERCEVSGLTDVAYATRKVTKGGSKSLVWKPVEGEEQEFGTTSKSQAELDELIPPFETWRRCNVFSSHDAALFATATDATRKQLLENLLGISRFESALKACRADLSAAKTSGSRITIRLENAQSILSEKRRRLEEAKEGIESVRKAKHPGRLKAQGERLSVKLEGVRGRKDELEEEMTKVRQADARAKAEVGQLERELSKFAEGKCPSCGLSECPNCNATLILDLSSGIEGRILDRKATMEDLRLEEKLGRLSAEVRGLNSDASELTAQIAGVRKDLESNEVNARTRAHFKKVLESAEEEIAGAEATIEIARQEAEQALLRIGELRAVEQVLGLKGVRAHVLGRALEGLEAIASGYVRRMIGPDVTLRLRPYKELKGGGTEDSISMELSGVGGDYGYKANSGGQRRCVDISLLLGLASVSDASRGAVPGTIWFDEVFDALDRDRIGVVSEIMAEMARERPVVVISHNPELVEDLLPEAELHLSVKAGKIAARAA